MPPFSNSPSPLPYTAVSCLLPYRNIPYSGSDIRIDGKLHHTESGDCLIFPEGCRRCFFHSDEGHRSIWAHFRIRLGFDLPLLNFFKVPPVIRGTAALRCRRLISTMNQGSCNILSGNNIRVLANRCPGSLADQLEVQGTAFLLLKEILAVSQPKETLFLAVDGFHELENAVQLIHQHKFEKLSLDELAQSCHCSRSSFEKKFRRVFGTPPGQYLLNLRLSAAETMLRETDDSCAQIAEVCGFANQFIFSRLFSRRYGIPPRDYRSRKVFC
ncbi:MAG: helix-turn-helix transcriptional regulator [Lentisphaeria bacterium]|nr:helix-turn-helix transcriptional regulator [Lentisphaeria bacterium]